MNRQWDVLVVGGANTDYQVRGPELPEVGETVIGETFQEAPGGKGANQAVGAARLGARVAFVGRVGRDVRGDAILDTLQAEGVDVRYVARDPEAVTGVALIMVEEKGEKRIMTAPGANMRLSRDDVTAAGHDSARVVLTQFEVPMSAVIAAAWLGHDTGAKEVLDPAPPRPLPEELFRLVHVIKPNADEAEVITGISVKDRSSARRAADWFIAKGIGVIAVQAGDEGNLLVWSDGEYWLPRLPVNSVDATGAGDAFAAALAVAMVEDRPWEEAGAFANAAAALKTTVLGAQAGLPRRDAVMALLASNAKHTN